MSQPRSTPPNYQLMLGIESNDPVIEINVSENGPKATVAVFAPLSDHIITGHENGKIGKYDVKSGKEVNRVVEDGHRGEITDIQLSPDGTYFITSSKDKTARVGPDPSGNVACADLLGRSSTLRHYRR